MQALLRSYRWDWEDLRAELPALARAWLPCDPGDLIGPGIAVDETAQLKDGDATACVAPQHAGCTGHVENCVTTVFSAWVTTSGQAWADFDVFMPQRWETDWQRRRAARIPGGLGHQTKPQLAIGQLRRLLGAGLPVKWAAYDEVYGRSSELRRFCESGKLPYVAVIPRDFRVTLPSGAVIRADQAAGDAVFEQRSCGNGSKGPRFADWALMATSSRRHVLLIRRLLSRPDDLTFYLCWAPEGTPATMTFFVTIAGRRWPAEQTFKTGKDTLGWDQCQARAWDAVCLDTALAALAQLRQAAVRNHLCGDITLPDAPACPAAATTTVTTATTSALTRASRSGTLPCPLAADSPARPASPRSGSPSPRPPASNAWPGSTPPGSSPAPASPSACAGPAGGAATKPAPGGTTTAPGSRPRQPPDPQRPEGGDPM